MSSTEGAQRVLTNEKRSVLKVVSFDKSPFMLIMLRFSNKSVQAPSSEGPKLLSKHCFSHLKYIIVS
jgi:hypothetical protein